MGDISDFRKDVEVVVQALERQKRDDPWEEGEKLYRKYRETKKNAVRLAVALRGFFLKGGVSKEQRDDFGRCIQDWIVPAVQELIEEDAVEKNGVSGKPGLVSGGAVGNLHPDSTRASEDHLSCVADAFER